MRAIRVHAFGAPEQLVLDELPTPSRDGARAELVRVRMHAAAVNPVDTYIRAGTYATRPELPYIPGFEGAGVIEALPASMRAEGFSVGDRVIVCHATAGAYAEYALCAPEDLMALPARVDFAQGAATWVSYATAFRALHQIGLAARGERVLVHGASGGVGLASVQLAVSAGMEVFGTASSAEGRALVLAQGAQATFDHGAEGYEQALMAATDGEGFSLILEMAAHINLDRDLDLVAKRGRVVVIGNRAPIEINPRKIMSKESSISAAMLFGMNAREKASAQSAIAAGLADGSLTPLIQERFPLEDASNAHQAVMRDGARGKIVLEMP
ncbi:MAG: NADPH:quinone reductase [Myxococcota bacterium]|nr:NADPH:quinone reductase [Myxococcota bacterium]